jgi:hypothetical protein
VDDADWMSRQEMDWMRRIDALLEEEGIVPPPQTPGSAEDEDLWFDDLLLASEGVALKLMDIPDEEGMDAVSGSLWEALGTRLIFDYVIMRRDLANRFRAVAMRALSDGEPET